MKRGRIVATFCVHWRWTLDEFCLIGIVFCGRGSEGAGSRGAKAEARSCASGTGGGSAGAEVADVFHGDESTDPKKPPHGLIQPAPPPVCGRRQPVMAKAIFRIN